MSSAATSTETSASLTGEPRVAELDAERLRLLGLAALGSLRQFQFEGAIGAGSMARVYLAQHKPTGRRVAVKVMQPHLMNEPLAVARFQREVRALRSLDHPHITATIDAGDADAEANGKGVCWLCCPYLDGGTLAELLQQTGPMPTSMAVPIVGAVLEGIAHAHAHGVLHRDIKPQNILLSRSGDVQISDFGIARIAGDAPLTRVGFHAGTPAYMAPEQGRGEEVDARSDLFSVGVILVELLRGSNPFVRETVQQTLAAVAAADIGAFASDFPVVAAVVRGLVAADRDARFNSANDVLAILRPLLEQFGAVEAVVAGAIEDPVGAVDAALDAALDTMGLPGMGSSIPSTPSVVAAKDLDSVVDLAAAASGFDDGAAPQPIFRPPAVAAAPRLVAPAPRPLAAEPAGVAENTDLPPTLTVPVPAPPKAIPWPAIAAVVIAVVAVAGILLAAFR
jgi:serine/threonine-protein kinase